jgi:hypothetical protein
MSEFILTLSDVERFLSEYEEQTGLTTEQFRVLPQARAALSEDLILEWEAMIDHKRALEESQDELHREYLNELQEGDDEWSPRAQELLAA